ncbi:formate dehydrogenase subunit gamma [Roseivivax isoporae]|uniref:Formate dehydrogenase subunit gamma n=1 Tax=Roseivivax isoporae LMG 25204 TaxID=1449351 RepID=X7FBW1_9RHOB|nr:formate dehydrogenase subunit gamma [Roseivivax isoporae]ETX30310.1 formate dehydrogenase subunit gamma [Roseivivax isoporae LMG 25204]
MATTASGGRGSSGFGWFLLIGLVLAVAGGLFVLRNAEPAGPPQEALAEAREAVGGASSLEDILARQQGLDVDRTPRDYGSAAEGADEIRSQLGTLGGTSDAEVWEALRFGTADVRVSAGDAPARVLMQDNGMWWQQFRQGPLSTWGGILLLGTIGVLTLFFLVRGRVRIGKGKSGRTILRFTAIERFAHWLLAGSFILLGLTGLITLFGRKGLIPLMGKDGYATLALYSKWIHNNVSWAFMLALVLVFLFWVWHNLPDKTDLNWIAKGGGIFGKEHPPAKKFNAGQKVIFWSVVIFGASISASGLSLLFPFEIPMFAKTFGILNDMGVPAILGLDPFPAQLAPHEEMQYAQLWHAIVGFVLMAIIIAHIYIGTVGMEGAYDAMGSGQVDVNWAREHHSIWAAKVEAKRRGGRAATPAE